MTGSWFLILYWFPEAQLPLLNIIALRCTAFASAEARGCIIQHPPIHLFHVQKQTSLNLRLSPRQTACWAAVDQRWRYTMRISAERSLFVGALGPIHYIVVCLFVPTLAPVPLLPVDVHLLLMVVVVSLSGHRPLRSISPPLLLMDAVFVEEPVLPSRSRSCWRCEPLRRPQWIHLWPLVVAEAHDMWRGRTPELLRLLYSVVQGMVIHLPALMCLT